MGRALMVHQYEDFSQRGSTPFRVDFYRSQRSTFRIDFLMSQCVGLTLASSVPIIPGMFFRSKKPKEPPEKAPAGEQWIKCPKCGELVFPNHWAKNLWVCPQCGYHERIRAHQYLQILLDEGAFVEEIAADLLPDDPLGFPGYPEKLQKTQAKTGLTEAALAGTGHIGGHPVVLFITDFAFFGGSMGSVMGEKFVRAARYAIEKQVPFIALTASGGGARMHEGIISLMQMAKTTVLVNEMAEAGILYINILADPTMGGVMASFASLGDIIIAEPGALLGFAGPRVIRDTIKQELPPGFQTAEFLLEHGMIDLVVPRKDLKKTLVRLFDLIGVSHHG